jgi:CelD/BcsL family acetyltransferase involved in cellulose biosynthesis
VIRSWLHLYGFLGTPLVAPERGVEAVGSLLSAIMGRGPWPRIVVLELFGDDGPVASYLRSAAAALGLAVHVRFCGERAVFHCQDGEASLDTREVKRERRTKARQWRRLRDDWGEPAVIDLAGQQNGSEAFLEIEASGWKGRAGTALASRASDAAFYREVIARFSEAGRLHLYALEANGNTLAMQTNLCAGTALFDWKAAYDEQFASYGPGVQLQLRVLELARRNGLSWIDTCSDVADEHQLRLSGTRRRVATVMVLPGGRLPLVALALRARLMKARHEVLGRRPR